MRAINFMKMDFHEECSICLGTFREPRILPCHHYFCTQCLQKCINSDWENSFRCPLCRAATSPEDRRLPLYKWAKGFPIVNTETKKENPFPSYCADCMQNHFYVDAIVDLKRRMRLCYGCYNKNNQVDQQQGESQMAEDRVVHDQQILSGNPVAEGLLFCSYCRTFSYDQHYVSKHTVCIEMNANAIQPYRDAAKEMREKMESMIKKLDDLQEMYAILLDLPKLGQTWQNEDLQRKIIFSMDENIMKDYSKHLTTLDETMCKVQGLPKRMLAYLKSQESLQNMTDDLQYLKIQSFIEHYNDECLRDDEKKLAEIAETIKTLEMSFQIIEETSFNISA